MFFDRMYFFFSSQNFKRGGALAPSMDAPPLIITAKHRRDSVVIANMSAFGSERRHRATGDFSAPSKSLNEFHQTQLLAI